MVVVTIRLLRFGQALCWLNDSQNKRFGNVSTRFLKKNKVKLPLKNDMC